MAEIGLDISGEHPKPLTGGKARPPGVVITMGCGDAGPVYPGQAPEDWDIPRPGRPAHRAVRPIRGAVATVPGHSSAS
jgi:hypothetical protein